MPIATRTAETDWEGNAARGSGTVTLTSSSACGPLPVSLATRTEQGDASQTNAEELIAAAHSSCYAMALTAHLSEAQTPPERLHVTAAVTLDKQGDGFAITKSALSVQGTVPGFDQARFEAAAREAEQACPVSNALRGNVELSLEATHSG